MNIEVDTRGSELGPSQFEDADGYIMPIAPGTGPRRIPLSDFPTGPEVGALLPDVVAVDQHGQTVDLHAHRGGQPAVLVFHRSAVW
ncbi:MAG: hypothetical protein ACKVHU_01750 [Acidimicrobiales bacterium]|jgi:hypothetical protein